VHPCLSTWLFVEFVGGLSFGVVSLRRFSYMEVSQLTTFHASEGSHVSQWKVALEVKKSTWSYIAKLDVRMTCHMESLQLVHVSYGWSKLVKVLNTHYRFPSNETSTTLVYS